MRSSIDEDRPVPSTSRQHTVRNTTQQYNIILTHSISRRAMAPYKFQDSPGFAIEITSVWLSGPPNCQ